MRALARILVVGGITATVLMGTASAAGAHPLGNFTVNHSDRLALYRDRITDRAVVDSAEIPTYQERSEIDTDHDGVISANELTAYATHTCPLVAQSIGAGVGTSELHWQVVSSSMTYQPGAAGLPTSRLTCELSSPATLSRASQVRLNDAYKADRVGWHEITAVGVGVQLIRSPVPAASITDELRRYPNDLLSSPLDVRTVSLATAPGAGPSTYGHSRSVSAVSPFTKAVSRLTTRFNRLVGSRHVTVTVGLVAVALSLLLGASHAALPGHGKTVMAAYLAGRRGSARDAVLVGATVTITHTAGVLVLGLLLSVSASLAGESLIRELGVVSGLLIASIGAALLRSALRARRTTEAHEHDHGASPHGHHGHAHHHGASPHGQYGHAHHHPHDHHHQDEAGSPFSRRGLVGMGVAGGLVPSPSALVVLLGAIALGRTLFGIALVLGYGVGMAITLTLAGLLLVRLRARLERARTGKSIRRLDSLARVMPVLTAGLVLFVGLGLAARGLVPVI